MEPPLQICLFGKMEVWLSGKNIAEEMSLYARWLLALLLLRQQPTRREVLEDLLWPEYLNDPTEKDESNAEKRRNNNFRRQLKSLRDSLKEEARRIKIEGEGNLSYYKIDVEGAFVDTIEFQRAIKQGRYSDDIIQLREALALYRGPVLQECNGTWVHVYQELMRDEYLVCLETLAQEALAQGEEREAIRLLTCAVAQAPMRQSAVKKLMTIMVMRDPAEALSLYHQLRVTLQENRALETLDPQIVQLYLQVTDQRKPLHQAEKPSKPLFRIVHFPVSTSSLIGRHREVSEVVGRLLAMRLITLVGTGGVGKTRLAQEVARRADSLFRDGIAFADLSIIPPGANEHRVLRQIAEALEVRELPTQTLQEAVLQTLAPRHFLLILDNCEQVLSPCVNITGRLLNSCPDLHVLATSRDLLWLPGEQAYRVPSLSVPAPEEFHLPEALLKTDSVQLFVARVPRLNFTVTPMNAMEIAWICHVLDGIPMALELAAANLDIGTEQELVQKLRSSFWFLATPNASSKPTRHQTLKATIEWSYDLLTLEEQAFLRKMSILQGYWTLEAATALHEDAISEEAVNHILRRLIQKSLVQHVPNEGRSRYFLTAPIRLYAYEQCTQKDDPWRLHRCHAAYYLQLATKLEALWMEARQGECLRILDEGYPNYEAALEWYVSDQDHAAALTLSAALWRYWSIRGSVKEGRKWLNKALGDKTGVAHTVLCSALNGAGNLAYLDADYTEARQCFMECLVIGREHQDLYYQAISLGGLANVANGEQDYQGAKDYLEESLTLFRQLQNSRGVCLALGNLANIATHQQRYDEAITLHRESITEFRTHGDLQNLILALNNLANSIILSRNLSELPEVLYEVFTLNEQLKSPRSLAHGLANALTLFVEQGQMETAAVLIGAGEALRERNQLPLPPKVIPRYGRTRKRVQNALGTSAFDVAVEQGRQMLPNEVTTHVLKLLSFC